MNEEHLVVIQEYFPQARLVEGDIEGLRVRNMQIEKIFLTQREGQYHLIFVGTFAYEKWGTLEEVLEDL